MDPSIDGVTRPVKLGVETPNNATDLYSKGSSFTAEGQPFFYCNGSGRTG